MTEKLPIHNFNAFRKRTEGHVGHNIGAQYRLLYEDPASVIEMRETHFCFNDQREIKYRGAKRICLRLLEASDSPFRYTVIVSG